MFAGKHNIRFFDLNLARGEFSYREFEMDDKIIKTYGLGVLIIYLYRSSIYILLS